MKNRSGLKGLFFLLVILTAVLMGVSGAKAADEDETIEIVFSGNGADEGSMASITVDSLSSEITLPGAEYTKTGYKFYRWNTEASGMGTAFKKNSTHLVSKLGTPVDGVITLYAVWNPAVYSITYDAGEGAVVSGNPTEYTIESPTIVLNDPVREGYDFAGWFRKLAGTQLTSIETGSTGNIKLIARWIPHTYTIKFKANGGSGRMQAMEGVPYGTTVQLSPNTFTRTGYSFVGWSSKSDGTGKIWASDQQAVTSLRAKEGASVTLYAQWSLDTYKITYRVSDAVNAPENPATYTVYDAVTFMPATREGYDFAGWYTDYERTNPITEIPAGSTGNVKIYASWTPHVYTLKFKANGGSGSMASQNIPYGSSKKVRLNTFTKPGYVFTGWSSKKDGTGKFSIADGESIKNLVKRDGYVITLYAQWRPAEYTVSFKSNAAVTTGKTSKIHASYDTPFVLPECGFTWDGFTFIGWNTEGDGTGITLQPGQELLNLTAVDGEKITLYAQWALSKKSKIVSITKKNHNTVTLTFREIPGRTGFTIYRSLTEDGEYTYLGYTRATVFDDNTAVAGGRYYYKVQAVRKRPNGARFYSEISEIKKIAPSRTRSDSLILFGMQYLGTPWILGGTSLTQGLDCSSFTQQCYASIGIYIPRLSYLQAQCGTPVSNNIEDWRPGDFLGYTVGGYAIGHAAIYMGDGWILQCSESQGGVVISRYDYHGGPPAVIRRFF